MREQLVGAPKDSHYWMGYLAYSIGSTVNGDTELSHLESVYREFMASDVVGPELRAELPPLPARQRKRGSRRRGFLDFR